MKRSSEKKEVPPRESRPDSSRWYRLLHQSTDPLFVLNHQRRILFVNAAWEKLTQCSLESVQGWNCKPGSLGNPDRRESLLAALAPPQDALFGHMTAVRRKWPFAENQIWEISFFPFCQKENLRGIIGRIVIWPSGGDADHPPLPAKLLALPDRLRRWHTIEAFDGNSPEAARLAEQIRLASETMQPVLITGEPGAGKCWTARAVHERGLTRNRNFAAIDCGLVPPALIANMLLSACDPSASASAGSIYLANAERLPRDLQVRICHWWDTARQNAENHNKLTRLIGGACSNWNAAGIAEKLADEFRCLFTVMTFNVPPLRERRSELQPIAERLLQRLAPNEATDATYFSAAALECLQAAVWPGNLTELAGALRQAQRRAATSEIQLADLPWYLRNLQNPEPMKLDLDALLKQVEGRLIKLAVERAKGSKSKAAEMLTIWRGRLIRRLQEVESDQKGTDKSQTKP